MSFIPTYLCMYQVIANTSCTLANNNKYMFTSLVIFLEIIHKVTSMVYGNQCCYGCISHLQQILIIR